MNNAAAVPSIEAIVIGASAGGVEALLSILRPLREGFKLPIIGPIVEKSCYARFTRTLSTTFAAGVPLVDALLLTLAANALPAAARPRPSARLKKIMTTNMIMITITITIMTTNMIMRKPTMRLLLKQ